VDDEVAMPIPKGRGKVKRYRTVKKNGKTMTCEIMEKAGPRGGHVVCHDRKKKKKRNR
jgi:hypothetical protein